jgi:hypothetical protein
VGHHADAMGDEASELRKTVFADGLFAFAHKLST